MELVDIQDLKSWGSNAVPVQFRPQVQNKDSEPGGNRVADADGLQSAQATEVQRLPLIDSHCHLDMVIERGSGDCGSAPSRCGDALMVPGGISHGKPRIPTTCEHLFIPAPWFCTQRE